MLKTPVLTLALLGGMAVLAPRAEAADVVRAIRIRQNPIVAPAMSTTLGDSVNGNDVPFRDTFMVCRRR